MKALFSVKKRAFESTFFNKCMLQRKAKRSSPCWENLSQNRGYYLNYNKRLLCRVLTMVRAILFLACILGLGPSLFSQDFFYSTRNYTAIDGLPQSQVRALAEDKSGYLWIGTEGGGLARFDGREFKVYTTLDGLLTNQVIGLRFDQKDNLWIKQPKPRTGCRPVDGCAAPH